MRPPTATRPRPNSRFPIAFGLALLLPLSLAAQPSEMTAEAVGERPRIGLVLAGGGAKGGAHVGVLKVLEQLRVPVDCIAGTSMGALVGAGYAVGLPVAEIERFVLDIDWPAVVGGVGARRLEPAEQKRLAGGAGSRLEVGLRRREIVTPSGLVDSSAIEDLLRSYVAHSRGVADFNRLPIPYRAVATDMVNGEMVVLDHGDLATAMRASMAIPGAFSPVIHDAQVLADGGIVRNIPVDVARNTCADVVIAVVLVKPPPSQETLVQPRQLVARSTDVMIRANERIQLATLGEHDIRIDVPMGDIGTADFERMPETIPLGEAAAAAAAARLAALALPEAEYRAWRRQVTASPHVHATIADVRFEGLERVNPAYLQERTAIRRGDSVDIAAISADAKRMSVLDEIESVSYRLEGEADHATLVWQPKEIAIGPDVLRPSLGFFGDGGGDLKFQLGVQHVRHWVNRKGAQWRNAIKLGYESLLATSLYQPLDVAQRFFVEPGLLASRSIEELYLDGDHVATYRFVDAGGRVDFGWNPSPSAQLRLGYWASDRHVDVETGEAGLPEADLTDAGLALSARYDSRDAASYSARGVAAAFEYQRANDALGSERDWERVEAGFRTALPFGRRVLWLSLAGGADLGDELPADRAFSLGGPRTLPAFQLDEIRAREYWLAEANFVWRLKEISPIQNKAIYGGFGVHAAGLYERVDAVDDGEVYGVSAYLAGPTRIGTVTLGAGANSEDWSVWFSLGRPVGKGSILDDGLFQ